MLSCNYYIYASVTTSTLSRSHGLAPLMVAKLVVDADWIQVAPMNCRGIVVASHLTNSLTV